MLIAITWNPDPVVFQVGGIVLRWYSLLIALSFILAYAIAADMIRREKYPASIQENGIVYFMVGLILGARLGHCFFYEPVYYLHHPIQILTVWKGGLSSHGAVLGMLAGMYFYARKVHIPAFWFYDKLALAFMLAGSLIRFGNLMNSESVGTATNLPWGFVFVVRGEDFARHPTQVYEALVYALIFLILYPIHVRKWEVLRRGYLTGVALALVFVARFFIEFLKDSEGVVFEVFGLNTGQLLSLPLIAAGISIWWVKRRPLPVE